MLDNRNVYSLSFFLAFCLLIGASARSTAQDLTAIGAIGQEKAFQLSGGVTAHQTLYHAHGIAQRRDPYAYYLSGNLNLALYGWNIPVSFIYSNQHSSFSQPFNRYALHPTYHGLTGHFGYTSMTFSNYTLNGHLFLGAGIDWNPEGKLQKLRISAMYGRLQKAIVPDTLLRTTEHPAFRRMGFGLKIGYGTAHDFIDFILFHASDDMNSLPYILDSLSILPQENLVLGINAGKTLANKLVLKTEFASSAITRDIRAKENSTGSIFSRMSKLYVPRQSSSYYHAFKAGITYQGGFYTLGAGYERIDPGYQTLGAYYFNQDLENMTANGTMSLIKNKVNVSTQVGIQHNNLKQDQISSMQRLIGSINISYMATQKLNIQSTYSNFQTFTNYRSPFERIHQLTPYDDLDTLDYTQLSQSSNLSVGYLLSNNEKGRHYIHTNLSCQTTSDQQVQTVSTNFYHLNTIYNYHATLISTRISLGFNGAKNTSQNVRSVTYGPTIAVNKTAFDKKLMNTLTSSWNTTSSEAKYVNRIWSLRLNSKYTLKKKHQFNVSLVGINRTNLSNQEKSFTELTGTLGYSYQF